MMTQARCTSLARCIIYFEHSLHEGESVKSCLQYRLIKLSKTTFGQIFIRSAVLAEFVKQCFFAIISSNQKLEA